MLFNSIEFVLFFPAVVLLYFLIPGKLKLYWLLLTSYVFYMGWNAQYALLLLFSTLITFLSGTLIGYTKTRAAKAPPKPKKRFDMAKFFVFLSFAINLALLFFFKYFEFVIDNINALFAASGRELIKPAFDVLLPVGISFYIFQALSYTMDVYRGDVRVEKNFFKYATFISFFPQLVAGPIERSSHLLEQFDTFQSFDLRRVSKGLMMMLWGFFEKIIIADRVAVVVNQIFNYYTYYAGFELVVGAVLFAVQIYCDFAGYSDVAIGAAQVMGFDLMSNFRQPYFSRSIAEFWRRWHISLSTWFRDYLYIPLGGNRKGEARKYINLMVVFLASGLWHGAAWTYVIWGGLNGVFQVIGGLTKKLRKNAVTKLKWHTDTFSHRALQTLLTFALVDLTWIFFRATTIEQAFEIIQRIVSTFNPWIFFDGSLLHVGFSQSEWHILLLSLAVLVGVSLLHENGHHLREELFKQEAWFRWLIVLVALFVVLAYGIYGPGFNAASFIYFQF